jgi:hypothetical protein
MPRPSMPPWPSGAAVLSDEKAAADATAQEYVLL